MKGLKKRWERAVWAGEALEDGEEAYNMCCVWRVCEHQAVWSMQREMSPS